MDKALEANKSNFCMILSLVLENQDNRQKLQREAAQKRVKEGWRMDNYAEGKG